MNRRVRRLPLFKDAKRADTSSFLDKKQVHNRGQSLIIVAVRQRQNIVLLKTISLSRTNHFKIVRTLTLAVRTKQKSYRRQPNRTDCIKRIALTHIKEWLGCLIRPFFCYNLPRRQSWIRNSQNFS